MKKHTIIIAEAGVNHNGSLARALEMVDAAHEAGADYVKFQTAIPSQLVAATAPKANYQKETTNTSESQLEMLSKLLLPFEDFITLAYYCQKIGIGFMSTPFDLQSIEFLDTLGQDYFKIPSGEIDNLPYLRAIAACGRPVILSCGMSTMKEIEDALKILTGTHPDYPSESVLTLDDIIVLHCNTQYPTPYEDVNLEAMTAIREIFGVRTGYSDHTRGIEVPIAAVALGATVIEKHFTLSRELPGPDHKASLEPEELREMVRSIRNVEKALGSPDKRVTHSEESNRKIARKSLVASRPIKKGELFCPENVTAKRPATGLSPMAWDEVMGHPSPTDFDIDENIRLK
ncbi:MAG: N-acetylneuraminate synthase [Clostridium sp.]|nr:N-acetylneuraminate synthase [Prevotella sp.]MCM1429138.1 N-acetylneuraminate synthase [Clostridium sp.]MCM1475334.1 N-acetylneuraminate synthase [Muribaculaceae bacterium]